ncbi:MAG: hypothetical protein FJW39_22580 [Acidobacteria bacterium]|nr:hypothetical protein [Acidobacteriota bacterium]
MAQDPELSGGWRPSNYYNYYTEVEEHFQRVRGTALFQMSTLDWALLGTWKEAGIPLEAVLRGIEAAFEKWRAKKVRGRAVNSLTYCTQAVIEQAEQMQRNPDQALAKVEPAAPFTLEEFRAYLAGGLDRLRTLGPGFATVCTAMEALVASVEQRYLNLEDLEIELSALEDKLLAIARAAQSEADLTQARRDLESALRPHRSAMTAPQLMMLEKQFLDRWLFEHRALPRLSLFYLR